MTCDPFGPNTIINHTISSIRFCDAVINNGQEGKCPIFLIPGLFMRVASKAKKIKKKHVRSQHENLGDRQADMSPWEIHTSHQLCLEDP